MAYYITALPMKDRLNNWIQIFNEFGVLLCTWSLFLFTNYVPDPILRYHFGQNYLYLIGFIFLVNILLLVWILFTAIISACKKKFVKCRRRSNTKVDNKSESEFSQSSSSESESSSDDSLTEYEKCIIKKSWSQRAREFHEQVAFENQVKALEEAGDSNKIYQLFKER